MNNQTDLIEYLLRLGDSALIQGQRLCQWCGKAPALEEELALMNVGLDLVGQARNWLEYAADLLNDGRDADHLAFRRDERAYRNLLLVEQPNGDYAVTILKQFPLRRMAPASAHRPCPVQRRTHCRDRRQSREGSDLSLASLR